MIEHRLFRRAAEPLGVIDVRRAQERYDRATSWVTRHVSVIAGPLSRSSSAETSTGDSLVLGVAEAAPPAAAVDPAAVPRSTPAIQRPPALSAASKTTAVIQRKTAPAIQPETAAPIQARAASPPSQHTPAAAVEKPPVEAGVPTKTIVEEQSSGQPASAAPSTAKTLIAAREIPARSSPPSIVWRQTGARALDAAPTSQPPLISNVRGPLPLQRRAAAIAPAASPATIWRRPSAAPIGRAASHAPATPATAAPSIMRAADPNASPPAAPGSRAQTSTSDTTRSGAADLVDRVTRQLARQLAIERERRGGGRWP
jgi:hypothetical protein